LYTQLLKHLQQASDYNICYTFNYKFKRSPVRRLIANMQQQKDSIYLWQCTKSTWSVTYKAESWQDCTCHWLLCKSAIKAKPTFSHSVVER